MNKVEKHFGMEYHFTSEIMHGKKGDIEIFNVEVKNNFGLIIMYFKATEIVEDKNYFTLKFNSIPVGILVKDKS